MKTVKEVVAEMMKNGAKEIKNVTIKNVTVTVLDSYTRLGLTLDKEVPGFRQNEEGEYVEGTTRVVFASAYSIGALLKDNDDAAFAANHLMKHPDALGMIMSRAKIDIVQQRVNAGEEYRNPFASEETEAVVFDHDTIVNHIVSLDLSDFGKSRLERLADMMLGF